MPNMPFALDPGRIEQALHIRVWWPVRVMCAQVQSKLGPRIERSTDGDMGCIAMGVWGEYSRS